MDLITKTYLNIIAEDTQTMGILRTSDIPGAQSKYRFLKELHNSLLADILARYFLRGELTDIDDPKIDIIKDLFNSSYIDRNEFNNNRLTLDQFILKLRDNIGTQRSNRGRKPTLGKRKDFKNGVSIYVVDGADAKEINEKTMKIIQKYWGNVISPKQLYISYLPNKVAFQKGYLIGVQNQSKQRLTDNIWLNKKGRRQDHLTLLDGSVFYTGSSRK